MADEFREMYPHHHDANVKVAFRQGFEGMKSDSADFVLNDSFVHPITIVLFFDSQIYLESIVEGLANKILDVFIYKFQSEIKQSKFKDFTPTNQNYNQIGIPEKHQKFDFSENPGTTFESSLPIIFEDTLVDYVRQLYLSLNGCNMQIPWIYVVQNRELLTKDNSYVNPDF
mgnify:CR=1 FL=1